MRGRSWRELRHPSARLLRARQAARAASASHTTRMELGFGRQAAGTAAAAAALNGVVRVATRQAGRRSGALLAAAAPWASSVRPRLEWIDASARWATTPPRAGRRGPARARRAVAAGADVDSSGRARTCRRPPPIGAASRDGRRADRARLWAAVKAAILCAFPGPPSHLPPPFHHPRGRRPRPRPPAGLGARSRASLGRPVVRMVTWSVGLRCTSWLWG